MWSLVDYVEMGRGTVSQSMMRRLESQIGLWLFPRREANLAPREQKSISIPSSIGYFRSSSHPTAAGNSGMRTNE
jgi:hypothetical protein